MSGGCTSRAEHAAAHHSRENVGWGFAAAERSSWAHVVCPLVLPLPEVETQTKSWTKRNNPWLLSAASTRGKAKGPVLRRAAILHLGRIRVYETNALDSARVTADPNATVPVLGLPEKVTSMSTAEEGRGLKKRIVAHLASCGSFVGGRSPPRLVMRNSDHPHLGRRPEVGIRRQLDHEADGQQGRLCTPRCVLWQTAMI